MSPNSALVSDACAAALPRLLQRATTRTLGDAMGAQPVHKKDPTTVRAEFPISDLVEGWFFRQREVSNGAYLVEGTDLWGRKVSRRGGDPEILLSECANDARLIKQGSKGVA